MKESDRRAAARGRGGMPASFGRDPDPQEEGEDFTIRGGQAFHLVLHVEVQPEPASLAALHKAIRETTMAAVLDGYADAFAAMDADAPPAGAPDPAAGDGG